MCGICGQISLKKNRRVDKRNVMAMAQSLVHRGPDDEGFFFAGPLGLGFRRLSIIDLEGGHQPMSDQEERVWVVFNGEIYNFLELREELIRLGHRFRTKSDTEVIVHGYIQWGDEVLNRLNGMFGLAIWETRRERLLLARDGMGIKPLYYSVTDDYLLFGSEIRALLVFRKLKPEVDVGALALFLRFKYTPSPFTIFKGIRKLAPGTCIIVNGGKVTTKRWYNYAPVPLEPTIKIGEIRDELDELYLKAVKRHLISDVPVGLLLSGGIDSGLLLALMKQNGPSWKTFSVGYGDEYENDELLDAARTSLLLGQPHQSIEISRETFERTLPKILSCLEEPIASSSIVPMYHVCELARKEVKVAFIGQGPDELFGGYARHLGLRYAHYWRALPKLCRVPIKRALGKLRRNDMIRRSLYSLDVENRYERYREVFSIMPGHDIEDLILDGSVAKNTNTLVSECWRDLYPLMEHTDELGGLQFLEIRSSLPDELLMYSDKLSMIHSLELRVPYLDRGIVEYVERLTSRYKIRMGVGKWLHRQVCGLYLPNEILKRKKRGFAVDVVDKWFRESLMGQAHEMFLDDASLIFGVLNKSKVRNLYADHQRGKHDNHKILFSLLALEIWMRNFIKN